jgi:hypothetical protein
MDSTSKRVVSNRLENLDMEQILAFLHQCCLDDIHLPSREDKLQVIRSNAEYRS